MVTQVIAGLNSVYALQSRELPGRKRCALPPPRRAIEEGCLSSASNVSEPTADYLWPSRACRLKEFEVDSTIFRFQILRTNLAFSILTFLLHASRAVCVTLSNSPIVKNDDVHTTTQEFLQRARGGGGERARCEL